NDTLLVVGYGSLMSGFGLLAESRLGKSPQLVALDAAPVTLRNARRGLAKPSSHGRYLAMDVEPIDRAAPITAHIESNGAGIGALALEFDRKWAPLIAQREEYGAAAFEQLITLADSAGVPLGEYLLRIAERTGFDLLRYRVALRELLGYTSSGYVFHPALVDDGRIAIIAIGAGFDGSGDSAIKSRRQEWEMDRLLGLGDALAHERLELDRDGQIGYFAECALGGLHGISVTDLLEGLDPAAAAARELAGHLSKAAPHEAARFLAATSMDERRYRARFTGIAEPALAAYLGGARGAA
ncbi:MAG: hypothetical protein ACREQF_03310, partial [Candidatus Binataceae bacterium]